MFSTVHNTARAGRRAAFTLVELLVAIAVIGILIALLLPALQSVREAARVVQCKSNLRQVGLALQSYHDVRRRFPAGCQDTTRTPEGYMAGFPAPPFREFAWSMFLLPGLEQQAVYDRIDLSLPFNASENEDAAGTDIPTYLCPSVERTGQSGETDYGGIHGEQITRPGSPNLFAGMLVHDDAFSIRDIGDGASNTLMVAEDTRGPNKTWIHGRNVFAQMYGVNDPAGAGDNEIRSDHAGGAVGLFADGHVVFLENDTPLEVLAALITRHGRESVEAP